MYYYRCALVCYLIVFLQLIHCKDEAVPKLLVISFDGFRWDYIDHYETPTFDSIAKRGVHASIGLKATFVTKTFPSHFSIATGLYEESHGIIDNKFYDPLFNETFVKSNRASKWWNGEPIWVTAMKQGKKTGIYYWVGSDVKFDGRYPNYWYPYDANVTFEQRINTTVDWITNNKVDLAMVYFNQPDRAGHDFGAFSEQVRLQVEHVDSVVHILFERLASKGALNQTNIIILSDHGMTNLTDLSERFIVLDNYLDLPNDVIDVPQTGSLAGIWPQPGQASRVYNQLLDVHPNMTLYFKDDIPERFHYKNNRRIPPIIAIADEGFLIYKTEHHKKGYSGSHGYDNELPSMNPIFYAIGPDFQRNVSSDIFETVNIYSLMCHLLRIDESPNNGSIERVAHILTETSRQRILSKSDSAINLQIFHVYIFNVLIIANSFINFSIEL